MRREGEGTPFEIRRIYIELLDTQLHEFLMICVIKKPMESCVKNINGDPSVFKWSALPSRQSDVHEGGLRVRCARGGAGRSDAQQ